MLNKAVAKVKSIFKKEEEPEREKQVWRYWENCIKRAEKDQKEMGKDWTAAEDRLKCKNNEESRSGDEKPYVNGFRQHYEALKGFLDQTTAGFKVVPTDAFVIDSEAIKQAECDYKYLTYVWGEQKCQAVSSQKLDSTIIRNLGVTLPGFDRKKWMPNLKYVAAKNLFSDPDCEGIREKANWEGFKENISIEELVSKNDLTEEEIEKIKSNAGSLLSEEEQVEHELGEPEHKMFTVVTLYHIFARNDAAIRKLKDDEQQTPEKKTAAKLNLTTPKRYLQFVKGLERPLRDEDNWPYDLDDNEFPTTVLMFNKVSEDAFGFTDHKQMSRLDTAFDNVMYDIEQAAYWEANKKFAGTPEARSLTNAEIEDFLANHKKTYLAKMIGADGKPKIQQIDTGKFSPELVTALKVIDEQRDKASAIGELLFEKAAEYKDVTATSALIHESNIHQKINRRLGGPEGYEMSMTEDAIKMLEIAHQFVPRHSLLRVPVPKWDWDEAGNPYETSDFFMDLKSYPWPQAKIMLNKPDVKLVKLGVDAIVGQELAAYWRTSEECPPRLFKLSTKIKVLPGSTRSITKEHRAGILKQYYVEIYLPLYQVVGRWDLAVNFVDHISTLIGLTEGKDFLPDPDWMKQFVEQQYRMAEAAQAQEAETQNAERGKEGE